MLKLIAILLYLVPWTITLGLIRHMNQAMKHAQAEHYIAELEDENDRLHEQLQEALYE